MSAHSFTNWIETPLPLSASASSSFSLSPFTGLIFSCFTVIVSFKGEVSIGVFAVSFERLVSGFVSSFCVVVTDGAGPFSVGSSLVILVFFPLELFSDGFPSQEMPFSFRYRLRASRIVTFAGRTWTMSQSVFSSLLSAAKFPLFRFSQSSTRILFRPNESGMAWMCEDCRVVRQDSTASFDRSFRTSCGDLVLFFFLATLSLLFGADWFVLFPLLPPFSFSRSFSSQRRFKASNFCFHCCKKSPPLPIFFFLVFSLNSS
mmetsp:Transcript_7980/g.16598  ORF Transcript_7980/g.16598 Transcript_7980/m.16598 type:complete len:260 (+) Transcript_7980:651-1430(+)